MNENKKLMSGIKSKLLAAVCMLLVAVIMVVSSTYAWFTLSTAPEVTGITTAVGANGALEMLLLKDKDESGDWIYRDSPVLDGENANNYWGNLVDVTNGYGLNLVNLYPSKLNTISNSIVEKGTTFSNTSVLMTPVYDHTGRVTEVTDNTLNATFNGQGFYPNNEYGIRAIGTASGMTARELAYRNYKSNAPLIADIAKGAAIASLENNGSSLADIAIKYGLNGETTTFTLDEIMPLYRLTEALLSKNGALAKLEEAYLNYIIAIFASAVAGENDLAYQTVENMVQEAINDEDLKTDAMPALEAVVSQLSSIEGISVSIGPLNNIVAKLSDTIDDVQEAYKVLGNIINSEEAPFTWDQISDAVSVLINTSTIEVNDKTVSDIKDDIGGFASSVLGVGGIKVKMSTGAGVYADIADHLGNYEAGITLNKFEFNGTPVPELPATMIVSTTNESTYLGSMASVFNEDEFGEPPSNTETKQPLSEFYGYIVDLAFRTNASNSNLLLQTEATDRIYENNSNPDTQGSGSSMTFVSGSPAEFKTSDVAKLMEHIRIIFFEEVKVGEAIQNTVLATAKLDLFGKDSSGDEVINYTISADGGVTANMYLYEIDETTGEEVLLKDTNAIIKTLTQNQAHNIHVLVYLDGETIKNADVAATAKSSMTGKMNLQFASSAALVPMEYADLHQTGGSTSEEGEDDDNTATSTNIDVTAGGSVNVPEYNLDNYEYSFNAGTSGMTFEANAGEVTATEGAAVGSTATLTATPKAGVEAEAKTYTFTVVAATESGS